MIDDCVSDLLTIFLVTPTMDTLDSNPLGNIPRLEELSSFKPPSIPSNY